MKNLGLFFGKDFQIFTLSLVVCAGVFGAAVWFFLLMGETASTYTHQLQLVADTDERQKVVNQVRNTLERSAQERAALDEYFLDVVQIAQFLEMVEQHAEQSDLSLESRNLTTSEANELGLATVRIPYEVAGPQNTVMDFIRMMETLPYHSHVSSVHLRLEEGQRLRSELEVVISYTQYD